MNASAIQCKQIRLAMCLVAMLVGAAGAKAGEWNLPIPLCLANPVTFIPVWSIATSRGDLCFVGPPPTAASTTFLQVPLVYVIVKLKNANNTVAATLDPTQPLNVPVNSIQGFSAGDAVYESPIFSSRDFTLGSTNLGNVQWGEVTERASFWSYPRTNFSNWRVIMQHTTTHSVETLEVPSGSWIETGAPGIYVVDQSVLDPFLLKVAKLYSGQTPILLTYNVGRNVGSLYYFGYHHTFLDSGVASFFIWGSYLDAPGVFGQSDLGFLSHEVAEFMHDPFGTNPVRSWPAAFNFSLPWAPPYMFTTCQTNLEVGDPLEDRSGTELRYVIKTPVMTYHFQNVVTASWFMQAKPSFSVNGWYTLKGAVDGEFAAPAPVCPTP
jgi:hypothetical protein